MILKYVAVSLVSFGVAFAIAALIKIFRNDDNKKLLKIYESIQIGDEYIRNKYEANPFYPSFEDKVKITDKRLNKDGIPYVKFDGEHMPFCVSASLYEFLEIKHYEPYTGQDKE